MRSPIMTSTIEDDLTRTLHEGMPLTRHNDLAAVSADTDAIVVRAECDRSAAVSAECCTAGTSWPWPTQLARSSHS